MKPADKINIADIQPVTNSWFIIKSYPPKRDFFEGRRKIPQDLFYTLDPMVGTYQVPEQVSGPWS